MQRVLLVDDDLRALRDIAARFREEATQLPAWRLSIATRAHALELIEQESFDVIVSDDVGVGASAYDLDEDVDKRGGAKRSSAARIRARSPSSVNNRSVIVGHHGSGILGRAYAIQPETIRIGLTEHADDEHAALRAIPLAHQSLAKPLRFRDLEAALARALRIRTLVSAPEIRARLGDLNELPALPQTYSRLCAVLDDPFSGMADVARVVETDVAATAKVLQLVNSAFLGLGHPVRSILEAVQILGADMVKTLVLSAGVFSASTSSSTSVSRACEALQLHSIQVAHIASSITTPDLRRDSLTAGLLHDVGWLILVQCADAARRPLPIGRSFATSASEPEDGGTHAAIGAYLLGLWGLPLDIIDAVARHHEHVDGGGDGEATNAPTEMMSPVARNVWRADRALRLALKEQTPTLRERAIALAREL